MPYVQNGTIKLYYEEKGEGPAVILIHDLVEDHLFWKTVQDALSQNFRVISFDLRGVGQSSTSKDSFKIEDCALDVIAIADELKLEQFHVVGDSMGGAIAMVLARKHPKRVLKLVLSNAYLELSHTIRWSLELLLDIYKKDFDYLTLYKIMMPWYYSARFLERDDDPKNLIAELKKRKHPLKRDSFKKLVEAICGFKGTNHVKHIAHETLVLIAEEDVYCMFKDSRSLVRGLKNHQVELLGGGHSSKKEHPNRYIEVLGNFFTEEDQ